MPHRLSTVSTKVTSSGDAISARVTTMKLSSRLQFSIIEGVNGFDLLAVESSHKFGQQSHEQLCSLKNYACEPFDNVRAIEAGIFLHSQVALPRCPMAISLLCIIA